MHLGLVGGFGNSISFRGMRFPSLEKCIFGLWRPNSSKASAVFGFRDGMELQNLLRPVQMCLEAS